VIRDLLWGCVICGELETLRMIDRIEQCTKCGAKYRRAQGATIRVEVEDRGVETRSAAEWTSQLPPVSATGTAEVLLREAIADLKISGYGKYLGRIERFGDFHFGQLTLNESTLSFVGRDGQGSFDWPLSELTGVQPSSTALQIKARKRPVISVKFVNSSSRLWEERLQVALREHHKGCNIIEFQPRVSLR
jgi:hypothetical protein